MDNKENLKDLIVSHSTFENILRYKHELIIDINEAVLSSKEGLVKETLIIIDNEIYHHLEFFHKIIINFLYFKESNILISYIQWLYRFFFYKGINLDFFIALYEFWIDTYSKYFTSIHFLEMKNIFLFLIKNHNTIKTESFKISFPLKNQKEIDIIYDLLIKSKKDEFFTFCKKDTKTLEDFIGFFDSILSKSLHKVGLMWEKSEISVAKEHIASTMVQELVIESFSKFEKNKDNKKTVLISTAPNEYHGIGLIVISKLLRILGFNVIDLGNSGTPSKGLINVIDEFKPDFVVFGVSLTVNLYDVALLIKEIKIKRHDFTAKIILGGNAFNEIKNPANKMYADFYCKNIKDIYEFFIEEI